MRRGLRARSWMFSRGRTAGTALLLPAGASTAGTAPASAAFPLQHAPYYSCHNQSNATQYQYICQRYAHKLRLLCRPLAGNPYRNHPLLFLHTGELVPATYTSAFFPRWQFLYILDRPPPGQICSPFVLRACCRIHSTRFLFFPMRLILTRSTPASFLAKGRQMR